MSENKLRVGILFGGKSGEHEVSITSALAIIDALDKTKYEPVPISIDKKGRFFHAEKTLHQFTDHRLIKQPFDLKIDVVFPALHGPYGEDGSVQGLLRMLGVPFVGMDHLAAAICMDKDITKRLLTHASIPTAPYLTLYAPHDITFAHAKEKLAPGFFIKPAHLGSSLGIAKVQTEQDYQSALQSAFAQDDKIILEKAISGREIEVGLIGDRDPQLSLPAEIKVLEGDFLTYEHKYFSTDTVEFIIPASLTESELALIHDTAKRAYRCVEGRGMARVDGFLTHENQFVINEINPIPGFTKLSRFPRMWEASGLPFSQLVDRLIQLALDGVLETVQS